MFEAWKELERLANDARIFVKKLEEKHVEFSRSARQISQDLINKTIDQCLDRISLVIITL